tara:strand:- start:132963 stop:135119 length:2157 start_codon:yes stop_codon:yes gene_type:complete
MRYNGILFFALLIFIVSCKDQQQDMSIAEVVDTPLKESLNTNYVSNQLPLAPSALIKLPIGAIQPDNWLKVCLERQAEGLMGNLGAISAWLQKEDNAWLSKDGKGAWGWEEVPYWLKGYANTAYILQDQEMIKESMIWIEAALASQRSDGNFGPIIVSDKDGTQDFWSNMIMLYCLQSYYEYSEDDRVIELMTNYFKYQLSLPDEALLSKTHYWQRVRGGDNLYSVLWLYNRTGDKWLLELAEKLHRNTAPWSKRDNTLDEIGNWKEVREGMEWPSWYSNLIDWHNVNVAQAFREPAQYYQLSHNKEDLKATYDNFNIIREHFGQVPGGMFGADENARPGYDDPRQGIETCGMVEQMNSDEHLLRITGDVFWADHAEEVAFNSLPAAMTSDFKSLRYITSPNMVMNDDKNHRPGIMNDGPFIMMNPFSSRCCQHNHGQGWPYLAENLWMATPDNGLAAVIYAANTVKAKVGDGEEVSISCTSNYPFEDDLNFVVKLEQETAFPLYFRIPTWCANASVYLNDEKVDIEASSGKYVRMDRTWKNGDVIKLSLPKELKVRTWEKNHNSVSVDYGPLTFSLKIEENYIRKPSDDTAIGDSKWQEGVDKEKWPSYEIQPATPWNYGLVVDANDISSSFVIETKEWPSSNFPFTTKDVPIRIKAKGKKIAAWTLDQYDLAGELKDSPVKSSEKIEDIELIPMGAARLRISAFPVIGNEDTGIEW